MRITIIPDKLEEVCLVDETVDSDCTNTLSYSDNKENCLVQGKILLYSNEEEDFNFKPSRDSRVVFD